MAIVDLYKVVWRNNRHNNANTQIQVNFVVAAPGAQADNLASLIQSSHNDNKNVTVDQVAVIQKGIIQ